MILTARCHRVLIALVLAGTLAAGSAQAAPFDLIDSIPTWGFMSDVEVDGAGNVRTAEQGLVSPGVVDNRIRTYDADGVFLSEFGGFDTLDGFGIDGAGNNVLINDFISLETYTSGGAFVSSFFVNGASDVVVDGSGNYRAALYSAGRIDVFAPDGTPVPPPYGTDVVFFNTGGMAIDDTGRTYVTDPSRDLVQVFNADLTSAFSLSVGGQPADVAVDSFGRIYALSQLGESVLVFDSSGTFIDFFLPGSSGNPFGLAVNPSGSRIYVGNGMNLEIYEGLPLPEPSALAFLAAGLAALAAQRARRRWSGPGSGT